MNFDMAKYKVIEIMKRKGFMRDIILRDNLHDVSLLGKEIRLQARHLLVLFYEIERELDIKIPISYVLDNKFITINSIARIVNEQNNKILR